MNKRTLQASSLICAAGLLAGCAVTEPTNMDVARIQSAVADEPTKALEPIALELGISQLAVARAMPDGYARLWKGDAASAWEQVKTWPIVSLRSSKVQFLGDPKFVTVSNASSADTSQAGLDIGIDWEDVEEAWLVRRPTLEGPMDCAVYWFDEDGEPILAAQVPDSGGESSTQAAKQYEQMWKDLSK